MDHRYQSRWRAAGSLRALWPWQDDDRGLLPPGDGVCALCNSYGLMVGLWQLMHPNERFGAATMQRPEMRVFHRDYKNPRVYSYNAAYEQQLIPDWSAYVDLTWTEGTNLTRFLNYNRTPGTCCSDGPGTGNSFAYGPGPYWTMNAL